MASFNVGLEWAAGLGLNVDEDEFAAWMQTFGIDIYDESTTNWTDDGDPYWIITDSDNDGNNIPDSLQSFLGIPVVTNQSQGGDHG